MANSNEYMREYMRKYSADRRLKALSILGGVCVGCSSKENLEIHHIDPETKSFTLAKGWHHAWNKILDELQKCQILCEDCHKLEHKSTFPCGTIQRYSRGCRCDACTAANTEYHKNYRKEKRVGSSTGRAGAS